MIEELKDFYETYKTTSNHCFLCLQIQRYLQWAEEKANIKEFALSIERRGKLLLEKVNKITSI